MARCSGSLWGRLWDVRALTCCSRLGVEFLKPLVFFVRGLKNTVGCLQDFRFSFSSVVGYVGMLCGVEVQVGVCRLVCHKLGCALGMLRFIFCSPLRLNFCSPLRLIFCSPLCFKLARSSPPACLRNSCCTYGARVPSVRHVSSRRRGAGQDCPA